MRGVNGGAPAALSVRLVPLVSGENAATRTATYSAPPPTATLPLPSPRSAITAGWPRSFLTAAITSISCALCFTLARHTREAATDDRLVLTIENRILPRSTRTGHQAGLCGGGADVAGLHTAATGGRPVVARPMWRRHLWRTKGVAKAILVRGPDPKREVMLEQRRRKG